MAKHLIIIIYFGLCLFLGVSVKAQISHGGQPLPLTATKSLTEDMFITMPPFDLAEQLRLDSLEATGLRNGFRFAYKFVTDYTPENSGVPFHPVRRDKGLATRDTFRRCALPQYNVQ